MPIPGRSGSSSLVRGTEPPVRRTFQWHRVQQGLLQGTKHHDFMTSIHPQNTFRDILNISHSLCDGKELFRRDANTVEKIEKLSIP